MTNRNDKHRKNSKVTNRPYCLVGASRLSAALWKDGDEQGGFRYRFNIFRMLASSGRVSQLFDPEDVISLAKLAHVMALALIDDGCIHADLRRQLQQLVVRLDVSLAMEAHPAKNISVVPITPETLSAIQHVACYYRRTEEDDYEGDLDVSLLLSNLEVVNAWLQALGFEPGSTNLPQGGSSH